MTLHDLTGETIKANYRVDRLIAQGGMGAVYRGRQVDSERRIAIKTLRPDREPSSNALARFEREARAASALHHPNIVEVIDVGRLEDGTLFLVMDLVDGLSMGDLIDQRLLSPRRSLVLIRQSLEAIAHAHSLGLVHRDLKPDNIMVLRHGDAGNEYDQVKLVDFGVVKLLDNAAREFGDDNLTAIGTVFGTPEYMPPEQALARDLDTRADLYSLGVVLFEMLTGRRPFVHTDPVELLRMHIKAPVPKLADIVPNSPWWTAEMEALVAGALRKKADNRYASAQHMIEALDAAFLSIQHLPSHP